MIKKPLVDQCSMMASGAAISAKLLVVLLLLLMPAGGASIPTREMDSMVAVLRASGYSLMSNAIVTSDLRFDLLSINSSVTLFAPPDRALFALDMSLPSSAYLSALRSHVVPRRLSASNLRRLSLLTSSSSLQTLLPGRSLHVTLRYRFRPRGSVISIDGAELTAPGIYYSRHMAAHGLRGSLPNRPQESHWSIPRTPHPAHRHRSQSGLSKPSTPAQEESNLVTPSSQPSVIPPDLTSPHLAHIPTPEASEALVSVHLPTPIPSLAPIPKITSENLPETNEELSPVTSPVIRAHWEELPLPKIANGFLKANIKDHTSRQIMPPLKGSNAGAQTVEEFKAGRIHVLKRYDH